MPRTVDAGPDWLGDALRCVTYTDASHGWAVGCGGTILATADGGATWTRQDSWADSFLTGVSFADATHGGR